MQGTQEEIQAIQARLQAISAREKPYRPATTAQMIEVFPASRPAAPGTTAPRPTVEPMREQLSLQWPSSIPYPPQQYLATGVAERSSSPVTERAVLTQIDETWQQLAAKAEHINQLASAQESALLELRAIAQRLERDWRATGLEQFPYANNAGDFSSLYQQSSATLPWVERDEDGNYLLASRTLDLLKAEREAVQMAQALRKKRRSQSTDNLLLSAGETILSGLTSLFSIPLHQVSRPGRRVASAPVSNTAEAAGSMSLSTAALWLMGSTVTRMAIDLVLISHPALYLPAILLIAAPAAIALYRTTVAPETSIQWGYRLLLIMVGLLLGGRF